MTDAELVESMVKKIAPILSGKEPHIQGAVLADLLSIWLAGHVGPDAKEVREELLEQHIDSVRELTPINEKIISSRLKRSP